MYGGWALSAVLALSQQPPRTIAVLRLWRFGALRRRTESATFSTDTNVQVMALGRSDAALKSLAAADAAKGGARARQGVVVGSLEEVLSLLRQLLGLP